VNTSSSPTGFVRAARASDAPELAHIQVTSWRSEFAGIVPDAVLSELTSQAAEEQWQIRWREAITKPPTSRHRVLVAVGGETAGFASIGPATDEDLWPGTDGELYELHVLPGLTGRGHGGRLLHAVADTLAEDGFRTAYTWTLEADEPRREFLVSAGWAPDGGHGNLDMGVKVPVLRLHTNIAVPA
jgi:GNAT superfamily N-acetyltransferase